MSQNLAYSLELISAKGTSHRMLGQNERVKVHFLIF